MHDRAVIEDLTAPHTPRLGPAQRARQALGPDRAPAAERLGPLQLGRSLGEPQVGVAGAAREVEADTARRAQHVPQRPGGAVQLFGFNRSAVQRN